MEGMANILNPRSCTAARPDPAKRFTYYGDAHGNGLRLRVSRNGAKYWEQRIMFHGKRRDLGLGRFPEVSLAEARELAVANKRDARRGGNPAANTITFRQASDAKLALDAPSVSVKQGRDTARMLETYALPILGDVRVADVQSHHVMAALVPIWHSKAVTAKRLLSRLAVTFDYCIAMGYRTDNPAASNIISAALPKQQAANGNGTKGPKHHESLPYSELAPALAKVDASTATAVCKALVRFVALTAVRISEAREARWSEFDLEGAVWTIPASRMKAGREHRVPLSDAALAILRQQAASRAEDRRHVFVNRRGLTLGDATVRKLFQSLKIGTVHGLRSSFRTWAAEHTDAARDVLEQCLAHAVGSKVARSYDRSDLLDKRRAVMDAWAEYLAS